MQHDDYPDIRYCGCVCAGQMEEDLARAQAREKAFKASSSRREKWLARRWRYTVELDSDGSLNSWECVKTQAFDVSVWRRRDGAGWAAKVEHRDAVVGAIQRGSGQARRLRRDDRHGGAAQ